MGTETDIKLISYNVFTFLMYHNMYLYMYIARKPVTVFFKLFFSFLNLKFVSTRINFVLKVLKTIPVKKSHDTEEGNETLFNWGWLSFIGTCNTRSLFESYLVIHWFIQVSGSNFVHVFIVISENYFISTFAVPSYELQ